MSYQVAYLFLKFPLPLHIYPRCRKKRAAAAAALHRRDKRHGTRDTCLVSFLRDICTMPNKAWPRFRSAIKEGRRAAADKCATRSFFPVAETAVVSSDATTATTSTDADSCRHPPPPHTSSSDRSSSSLGGALEGSDTPRVGEKSDSISSSPAAAARQGGVDRAASPRGGGTPVSAGKF